jgi:short-subunit dehydrogenase
MDMQARYPSIHVSLVMPGIVDTNFHKIAGTPMTARAGDHVGPARVKSADDVAGRIVSLIENPRAELYTDPSHAELVRQYFQDVEKFEENLTRSLRAIEPVPTFYQSITAGRVKT